MTTYYARKEYIYDNGDTIFSIPFSYIKPEHIVVLINGEDTKNYTYLNTTQIRVIETLNKGDKITIARTTPIDSRMVIFSDTSILDKDVLNLAQTQTFDAVQEIYDNNEVFKIETNNTLLVTRKELGDVIATNKEDTDNQIAANKAETDAQIADNKVDTDKQISALTASVNKQIADNKIDTDKQIVTFKQGVNTTISQNKADTDSQITELTASVNKQITDNKADTDKQIADFEQEVNTTVKTVKGVAENAVNIAEGAVNTANTATSTADSAVDIANTANTKSDKAVADTKTALNISKGANTKSDNAVTVANLADSKADNAITTANSATSKADSAITAANTAANKVDEFGKTIEVVKEAAEKVNALEESVEKAKTAAGEATQAAAQATQAAGDATEAAEAAVQALSSKQDVITDLATIRSGASKGATALQSIPSEYVTETELSKYHDNTKQNKLTFDTTPIANSTNPVTSSGVKTALDSKANSSEVVKTTGNQTIAGIKTFSSTPVITSTALNINNTNDVSLQKQGTNFIRKAMGGQLVLSASNASIYLRPKGDSVADKDKHVEIKTDGTVNATKFVGALQGNAATATKAAQDGSGNNIVNTYATKAALNAKANSSLSNLTDAGKQVIKDNSNSWNPPLLQPFWSDHILNRTDMLRSDTFSWQSGATYSNVYNELLSEYNNTSSTTKTDTVGSVTITYKLTPKGYKICDATQATNLTTLYNNVGIAWYYILDTTNKRFKLPRTKYGFVGLRDGVGGYVPESLPNITGSFYSATRIDPTTGAFTRSSRTEGFNGNNNNSGSYNTFDASLSSSTYQDNAPVQQRATQMYLYFYVGEYTQTAVEQTAGLNAELFNGKVDLNFNNMNPSQTAKNTIVEWGMPDYSAGISVTYPLSKNPFTAPCHGIFCAWGKPSNTTIRYVINEVKQEYLRLAELSGGSGGYQGRSIDLSKGDVMYFDEPYSVLNGCTFYPLKGAK